MTSGDAAAARIDADPPHADERLVDQVEQLAHVGRFHWRPDEDDITWSDELYRILGVEMGARLTLEYILSLMPTIDMDALNEARSTATKREPYVTMTIAARPDGEQRVVELRLWSDAQDTVVGTVQDMTTVLRLAQERDVLLRQRELVLSATADGICGLDGEGRITFSNQAAAGILRRSDEVLVGARLHDLVHRVRDREDHPASSCPLVRGAGDGMVRRARQDYFRRPDGTAFEAEYAMLPVDDAELRGAVVSFRDITDRVVTERRLRSTLRDVQALSGQRGRLLSEVSLAQERERSRIAADIHDDTVQVMSAVALHLERADPGTGHPELSAELDRLRSVVRGAADRLRRLLFDLSPPDLRLGLARAIETYAFASTSAAGAELLVHDAGSDDMPEGQRVLVYRLAQEAIANAVKHAEATRIDVHLTLAPTGFWLVVEDDGVGFEPGAVQREQGHFGLQFLRQRSESAGGQLRLRSGPGSGTRLEVWLPPTDPEEAP